MAAQLGCDATLLLACAAWVPSWQAGCSMPAAAMRPWASSPGLATSGAPLLWVLRFSFSTGEQMYNRRVLAIRPA